jgi:hypothetical protein
MHPHPEIEESRILFLLFKAPCLLYNLAISYDGSSHVRSNYCLRPALKLSTASVTGAVIQGCAQGR